MTGVPQVRHSHGQQRKQMKTQPWTDQMKISEESSEDAMSAEQERRSKPLTFCSGQSQVKEREKYQKTREGKHNVSGRAI